VLSGILTWASFPKLNQFYVAWVALVPLLAFVARVGKTSHAFLGGFISGVVGFLTLLYWIPPVLSRYGGLPAPGAWGLFMLMVAMLACYPAVVCAVTRYCMNRGGSRFILIFAPAWVCSEFLRGEFPFGGFPWLLLGYSQTEWLRIIQIADLAGVLGVSLLVAWMNTSLAFWLLHRRSRSGPAPAALGALMLMAAFAYGGAVLGKWDGVAPGNRAALLQGNLSIDEPASILLEKYQQGYVAMADRAGAGIDLLILPEAPSPIIYQHDDDYRETMTRLARRYPLGMIFNNICFREIEGQSRYTNCAYYLDGRGMEAGRYDKIHLVPFGEYIPWQKLFFFSQTISKDVGNFWPGSEYTSFPMSGHRVNTIICFEAIFPDLARRFVQQGSELMVNLTNDAWYGDTAAPLSAPRDGALAGDREPPLSAACGKLRDFRHCNSQRQDRGCDPTPAARCGGRKFRLPRRTYFLHQARLGHYLAVCYHNCAVFGGQPLAIPRVGKTKQRPNGDWQCLKNCAKR
jgi:apolipoprotein N-acyltransferase